MITVQRDRVSNICSCRNYNSLQKWGIMVQECNNRKYGKFWELEKRIKYDRRHPGVSIEIEKSNAIFDTVSFIRLDVITYDDLADFSDELQQAVKMLLDRYR